MLHRFLFNVLKTGLTAVKDDPRILDDLFAEGYQLDSSESEAIKTYFLAKPPTVINGYARQDTIFPAIAIVLSSEREAQNFLGDSAGQVMDDSDLDGADIDSAIWEYSYNLLIYSEHPDVTAYYYEITKSIMLAGYDYLTENGMFEFTLSGTELAPDPRYLPEHLFARQLQFKCQREFQRIRRDSLLLKAWKLSGIHVDKGGSPRDVGEVKTNVTIYNASSEGEDG